MSANIDFDAMASYYRDIEGFKKDLMLHLEMMAAAYLKATDIPPEECELVVLTGIDKVTYRFERRTPKEKA